MSHDGATIFGDLIGKLDVLRVHCDECRRFGLPRVRRLIENRGSNYSLPDWLDELAANCSKRITVNWNDRCGAQCPDLARVL
jgi:hypothetical protein